MKQGDIRIPDTWIIEDNNKEQTEYTTDFYTDVRVLSGSLNDDYVGHCDIYAQYSTLYELCEDYAIRMKDEMKRMESSLDAQIRTDLEMAKLKVTDKKVEKAILMRSEYVMSQDKYNAAKHQSGLAKRAMESIMHRKDMLVGLGANYRAEGQSTITLKQ